MIKVTMRNNEFEDIGTVFSVPQGSYLEIDDQGSRYCRVSTFLHERDAVRLLHVRPNINADDLKSAVEEALEKLDPARTDEENAEQLGGSRLSRLLATTADLITVVPVLLGLIAGAR